TDGMAESSLGLQEKLAEANHRTQNLAKKLERAEKEALVDPLTELYNRRAFDREVEKMLRRYEEEGVGFSLVVSDIDNFKKFNDEFGHLVGDDVLRIVGQILKHSVKRTDFASRYGGEEFFVLLPETALNNARAVAERIRGRLADKEFIVAKTGERVGRITVSLGVSATRPGDTVESLIERADKSLFLGKQDGGNTIRSEEELAAAGGSERPESA
ncbi:MAG TPA: GGDEF domain-containing protein, partial [Sumerlaeia bacterium]|nr:GGDEF domain-containing protein [Sumerlaeia bacterium]